MRVIEYRIGCAILHVSRKACQTATRLNCHTVFVASRAACPAVK